MATKIFANARFAHRADTLENWQTQNPVLLKGEPAIVLGGKDGESVKIGDGVTAFNDLPYVRGPKGDKGDPGEITKVFATQNFANALRISKMAVKTLTLDDISPVEHDLNIKLASKNLFNPQEYTLSTQSTTLDGDVFTTNFTSSGLYINRDKSIVTHAGKYVLSVIPVSQNVEFLITLYKATSKTEALKTLYVGTSTNKLVFSLNIAEDFVITILGKSNNYGEYSYKIQLEKGDTQTDFTKYVPDISGITVRQTSLDTGLDNYAKSNADGTVEGLVSLYPVTKLDAERDDITVSCEYNQDTNKVIENLTQAIISLGGNI